MTVRAPSSQPKKATHLVIIGSRSVGFQRQDDFYSTPPEAVKALCAVEKFDGAIWEPACGTGAISDALISYGYDVVSTDLVDRGYGTSGIDFLMESAALAPNIVTNPPYKLSEEFADQALRLATRKVAFLMRLLWLEGQKRKLLFQKSPLSRVWVFSKRLPRMHGHDFEGERTTSAMAFAWFVWEHGHTGAPVIGWLP